MNQQEYINKQGLYTDVPGPIMNLNPYSNVDYWYGPYTSVQEACDILRDIRKVGLTVGIYVFSKDPNGTYVRLENGSYVESPSFEGQKYKITDVAEYQWKSGIADEDLKPKVEQFNLTIAAVGETDITADEEDVIQFAFTVEGRSTISKGFIYQVANNKEVFVGEFTNIGKGTNTYTLAHPSQSGIYDYRLKILDSSGAYATTSNQDEYLSYKVRYGGITTRFNFTNLNAILIKNQASVAQKYFLCNILTRDESFNINGMYLCDSDENPTLRIGLLPYTSLAQTTQSNTYLGNLYYFLPEESVLRQFNDKKCYAIIEYTESGELRKRGQFMFNLLDVRSLAIQPESVATNYYEGIPAFYSFLLLSGVENISTVLTPQESSDFYFENVTVLSYRRFSLKVTPKTVKNNAQLKMNYSFRLDNESITGEFIMDLGNIIAVPEQEYYNPINDPNMELTKIVDASSEDYDLIEDGQYIKVINEPGVTNNTLSWSFIIDMYCKINQTKDTDKQYLTVKYGNRPLISITEEIITCSSIITDTPLNEWCQIGIGINIEESVTRDSTSVSTKYHCIYINGMAVKTIKLDSEDINFYNQDELTILLNNGILVLKCFLYHTPGGHNTINPNTLIGESIIYNNYKSHKLNFSEPENLPVLKLLKIVDLAPSNLNTEYFNAINAYKEAHEEDKIKHTTTFGVIGNAKAIDMNDYDYNYSSADIESNATLFRLNVNIKKPAQKEYAVLCTGEYIVDNVNLLDGVIIEVHTQGTSTLQYSIPNFKFTFWKFNLNNELEHFYPEFIKKAGSEEYYHEYIYTAKCDYMDSSHLNNTPTCIYYNNLIQSLIQGGEMTGSPSARNGGIDAIMGFPIIMEISDSATSFLDPLTNIGSFMFNVDKTGESLGFELEEGNTNLTCFSLEGTSNDNTSGASGRFIVPDTILMSYDGKTKPINNLKSYTSNGVVDEAAIMEDYNTAKNTIKNCSIEDAVTNLPYVQWCNFLSQGLEYRYPDSDIYKEKGNNVSKILKPEHFIPLYKMWSWVSTSDQLNLSDYKTQFVLHFDKYYCMIYFIQVMIFGQTDNLGKNAMFDCWGEKVTDGNTTSVDFSNVKWYPRPYDLDSQAGIENNGYDNIPTFAEIRPEFSLNYHNSLTQELLELLYLTENSEIQFNGQSYRRYPFSSNTSKLWITFYKNFKDEIESFYVNLKNNYNYTADSIISLCENNVINVLGTAQYNKDFTNKYLGNSDQRLAYGNRWIKFKKWLRRRFAFCDSYFGASSASTYNLSQAISYSVEVDAPLYVVQQYQDARILFALDKVYFSAGSGAATKVTLKVNQDAVMEATLFKYVSLDDNSPKNYSSLLRLDVSTNNKITSISELVGTNLPNLKQLTLDGSTVNSITIPASVKTVSALNVTLNNLNFESNCLVESLNLSDSTINSDVSFSMLSNLKSLNLSNCTFKGTVTFANLPALENVTFTGTTFEGIIDIQDGVNIQDFDFSSLVLKGISFSGTNLQIKSIKCTAAVFSDKTLNVNAISNYIEELQFEECRGLEHIEITGGNSFKNLKILGLRNSSIKSLGADNTIFEASDTLFQITGGLSSLLEKLGVPFTFRQTVILKIHNINWNGTGYCLFYDCAFLTEITGAIHFTTRISYAFYRCFVLATLPTITIDANVTLAEFAFARANSLGYNNIASIIRACTHSTSFSNVCRCVDFPDNQLINLTDLFGSNLAAGVDLGSAFQAGARGDRNMVGVTNRLVITGTIPSNVTSTAYMFLDTTSLTVPYNIFSTATHLTNLYATFACIGTITFSAPSGVTLPTYTNTNNNLTVTLTNTVDKDFFPTSALNIGGLFYATNILIVRNNIFDNLINLVDCSTVFGGRHKAFTVTIGNSTINVPINIQNIWLHNPNITTVAGCFSDVYNAYCTGLNFHDSVAGRLVDLSGLFALSNNAQRSYLRISINIDALTPKVILGGGVKGTGYDVPGGTVNRGAFENREVILQSMSSSVLSSIEKRTMYAFRYAILYVPASVTTFDLSKIRLSCDEMFRNCLLYKYDSTEGHIYSDSDRYFVNVLLPTDCSSYYHTFAWSSMLASLPTINANSANLCGMFRGCVINMSNVTVPYNYLLNCKTTVTNTSYMFAGNYYIETLEYNQNTGLFSDCINLGDVTHMFEQARFLHKGIPKNIFGTTELPRIVSLAYMFSETLVLYDIEDNSNKWIDSNTIAPLTNLIDVSGLFNLNYSWNYPGTLRLKVENSLGTLTYIIAPDIFADKMLSNINYLFKNTRINIPFRFKRFEQGREAFLNTALTEIDVNFVDALYIGDITNVSYMFYASPPGNNTPRVISNLGAFIAKIDEYPLINRSNIAGNLGNSDVPAAYKTENATVNTYISDGWNYYSLSHPIY